VVASAEDAVDPGEEHVAVVRSADGGERQHGQAAHEDGRLAEVLARDAALHGVAHHHQAEGGAAQGPRQAQVRLQQYHCLP